MHYAGIGTREPTRQQWDLCYRVGRFMAMHHWTLHNGAATGADQAYAEGALSGNGTVVLHLPWDAFEKEWVQDKLRSVDKIGGDNVIVMVVLRNDHEAHELVRKLHPKPSSLGKSFPLMSRNVRILRPSETETCRFVVAARSQYGAETGKGGTEFGYRLAQHFKIPAIDIDYNALDDAAVAALKAQLKAEVDREVAPKPEEPVKPVVPESPLRAGLDRAFPRTASEMPLHQVIERTKQAVLNDEVDKVDCPCCGQRAAIYKRSMNKGMATALVWFVRQRLQGVDWIPLKSAPGLGQRRDGDFAKMAHWGLVEQPEDGRVSGLWRATERGVRFVRDRVPVPKNVFLYNNQVIGYSEDKVTISDVLGTLFDLNDITDLGDPNDQREADRT